MSSLLEGIKDFLYDAIDYILILVVVLIVGGIIGWRLDILFAKEVDKPTIEVTSEDNVESKENDLVKTDSEHSEKNNQNVVQSSDDIIEENDTQDNTNIDQTSNNISEPQENVFTKTIKIPSGSLPPEIGDILLENNLINSKSDFLKLAKDLKLDTKLRSGSFKLSSDSSLETIIKTICGKN